ncbi:MAG TPA: alpha/beta hydrolase [Aestuariivirgaceae bacterium]
MWQAQIYFFARRHSVICYDLLGHGQSPRIEGAATLDDFTRQLENLAAALDLKKFALVGFSFGGLIAQHFGTRCSRDLERLVLMSTVYDRSPSERQALRSRFEQALAKGPASIYPAAIERWFSPAFLAGQPEQAQELHHRLLDNDDRSFLSTYEIFASADEELAEKLSAISCPTLMITGEHDTGSTPAMAWRMAKIIADARVTIIPGGRHMMPMEMPQEVNSAIDRFLRG